MDAKRKLLMVYSNVRATSTDDALDLRRLQDALRARGAVIEECSLESAPGALLDLIEAGAVPVVFRKP